MIDRRCAGLTALVLSAAAMTACASGGPREVTVVARGMTYVVAPDLDTPNPVIPLHAGEQVRLILKNEAPGLLHNFEIPAWDVRIAQIRAGQSAEVTFTVPSTVGRTEYRCRPHSELMKGFVEVTR